MGEALGAELARLHEAVDPDGFGNFGDAPGTERPYDSWGAYLSDYLAAHHDFLTGLGVSEEQLRRTHDVIRATRFVDEPRFLHGDVSVRNLAVYGDDPMVVGLFDPNPVSGDPSWDLAPVANKVALAEELRRRGGAPEQLEAHAAVWAGVRRAYGDVDEDRMLTAQLVQGVLQAESRHDRRRDGELDDREVEVADDFVRDLVDRLSG